MRGVVGRSTSVGVAVSADRFIVGGDGAKRTSSGLSVSFLNTVVNTSVVLPVSLRIDETGRPD